MWAGPNSLTPPPTNPRYASQRLHPQAATRPAQSATARGLGWGRAGLRAASGGSARVLQAGACGAGAAGTGPASNLNSKKEVLPPALWHERILLQKKLR